MGEAAKLFTRSLMMGLDSAVRKPEFAEPTAEDIENMPYHEAVEFLKKRDVIKKVDYDKLSDKMKFRAFTASRINDGKLLEKLNAQMLSNVNDGKGLKDFLSLTKTDILDKIGMGPNQGWYWETVYRTNAQTAYNVGRAMGFEADKPLALQFVGIDDARQTDVCHSLSGVVRPYGDPFWQSHFPPLHFNCRSTIRAIYDEAELPEEWSGLDEAESPTKGFGSYPLDSDNWWKELDSQVRQAKQFGVQGEIEAAKKILFETKGLSELTTPKPAELEKSGVQQASKTENIKRAMGEIDRINNADKKLKDEVRSAFEKQPFLHDVNPKMKEFFLKRVDSFNQDQLKLLKTHLGKIKITYDPSLKHSVIRGSEIILKDIYDIFHEFGHRLDDVILGDKRARDYLTNFLDILKQDALKWINSNSGAVKVKSLDKIPRAIQDLLNEKIRVKPDDDSYSIVSDFLDGLTNGKIGGYDKCGSGHEKGYFRFNEELKHIEGEAIANITESWFTPKAKYSVRVQEVFPNAYNMYVDFLRRQASVL